MLKIPYDSDTSFEYLCPSVYCLAVSYKTQKIPWRSGKVTRLVNQGS